MAALGLRVVGVAVPESLDVLIGHLDLLLRRLHQAVDAHGEEIKAVAPQHRRGAINLVHYTTLRYMDLRDLHKGPHILDALAVLDHILQRMDEVQRKSHTLLRHVHSWDDQ